MTRKQLIHYSYLALAGLLAASIPVSRFMISVFQFGLAGIFILEGISYYKARQFYQTKNVAYLLAMFIPYNLLLIFEGIWRQFKRISKNKLFLIFLLFSGVYLAGLIQTDNFNSGLKVLRNMLPILLLPMFFSAIRSIGEKEKQIILALFVSSLTVSSFISLFIFLQGEYEDLRKISPFINHIHLSIFANYAAFILFHFVNKGIIPRKFRIPALLLILWLLAFLLLILKSLTGVVILLAGVFFLFAFPRWFHFRVNPFIRFGLVVVLPAFSLGVILFSLIRFYDIKEPFPDDNFQFTAQGNRYHFDPNNRMLENGTYVFAWISEPELREEWNKRSNISYDSLDGQGHKLNYTLIRYISSKGLRKDAEGMAGLSNEDIELVEAGVANHLFSRKLSLYPRLYLVIWEFDMYFKTGNPTGQSVTQRIESMKMGLKILKRYPLLGIGTGDLVKVYHEKYDLARSPVPPERRITGANQFLNFMVMFGLLGFLVIMFSWFYPARKSGAFQQPLFNMFLIIALTAMFSEEILRFQTGVTFFAFFYGFFVLLKPDPNLQDPKD
jgi:O-antigen ligase